MSDKKIDQNQMNGDVIIADIMLRLTAIERLLIKKNIVTNEELNEEIDTVANQIAEAVLSAVKTDSSLSDLLIPEEDDKKNLKN